MRDLNDTKHCKIVSFKDRKDLEKNPILQRIKPRAVICPYKKDKEALVVFNTWKGKINKYNFVCFKQISRMLTTHYM